MSKAFNVVIEREAEGYFVGSVPELPGCHTQAKSLDELMNRKCYAHEENIDAKEWKIIRLEELGGLSARAISRA